MLLCFASCAVLDRTMDIFNPETGETEQVRVGDALADAVDESTGTAGSVLSMLTGNPILGGSMAALLAALAGAGLRKRRKTQPTATKV